MTQYFISDEHYGHTEISKYCNRGFSLDMEGTIKMNDSILSLYDTLPDDCTIWNLGDVFWFDNKDLVTVDFAKEIVSRMKGNNRKVNLVLGNHDDYKGDFSNCVDFYKSLGFSDVFAESVTIGKYIISHKPVYIPLGSDMINIHGHTHHCNVKAEYFTYDFDNYEMIKIWCDANNVEFPALECKCPEKIVDPGHYINVSYDKAKNFVQITGEILNIFL